MIPEDDPFDPLFLDKVFARLKERKSKQEKELEVGTVYKGFKTIHIQTL
jgi:hypothetical protein